MGATAIGGTALGDEALTDEVEIDEIHTQSADDVDIADDLEDDIETTDTGDTVEVFVRLDADRSTVLEETVADTQTLTQEQRAAVTQEPLSEYTDAQTGVTELREFWIANAVLLEVDTDQVDLAEIASVDGVSELHPNYEVELVEPDASPAAEGDAEEFTFGVEQVNAPTVYDEFDATGEDVTVGVVDTGIDPEHPALEDSFDEDDWAAFGFDGEPLHEQDDDFAEPFDDNDHGTHVSGTVAGDPPADSDVPQIGVAPDADIYAINVFPDPDGGTTLAAIVAGMEHAVEEDTDVANFSLGGGGFAGIYIEVIENAMAEGTLIVSSSGNDAVGSDGTPANVYDGLAVGATDASEDVAEFSTGTVVDTDDDWGQIAPEDWPDEYRTPDVSAPGDGVLSSVAGGEYAEFSGTSMAAPHTAGVTALMLSATDDEPTPDEIKTTLEEEATKPDEPGLTARADAEQFGGEDEAPRLFDDDVRDVRYGFGIVDAYATVSTVEDTGTIEVTVEADEESLPATVTVEDSSVPPVETDDGEFFLELPEGEYDLTAEAFGAFGTEEAVAVDADETTAVTIETDPVLDLALIEPQPFESAAGDEFEIDVSVANVEELTVELGEAANATEIAEEDVDVTAALGEDEIDLELGEALAFDEPTTGDVSLIVTPDEDATGSLDLDHTFAGDDDEVQVTTGPTELLDADAERGDIEITNFDAEEEVFFDEPALAGTVTIENTGDFTEDVTLNHAVDLAGEGDGPFLLPIDETVPPGEEVEVPLGPYNWFVIGGPGTDIDHQVAVNGQPDDESEIATTTLTGSGPIVGEVTDTDSDEPVSGAVVIAEGPDGSEFTATTATDGSYVITGPTEVGTYDLTIDAPGYAEATAAVESDDLGNPVVQDVALASDPSFELGLDADEAYAVGVPGPVEGGTVGDVIPEDTEGAVFAYDTGANDWMPAHADDAIAPMEALVVIPTEETTATVEIAGEPGEDGESSPAQKEIDEGWNFVAPTQAGEFDSAFGAVTEDVLAVQQIQSEPNTAMAPDGGFEGFATTEDVSDDEFTPFAGYFVFAENEGLHASALHEGVTLQTAYDNLGIDTATLDGTVIGTASGEPVEDAELDIQNSVFGSVTDDDGEYSTAPVPADQTFDVAVTAEDFVDEDVSLTTEDGDVALQEETFFEISEFDTSVEEGQVLAEGDEFEVTYEVTNEGVETATKAVSLEFGPNVADRTAFASTARVAGDAYEIDISQVELDAGETETFDVTVEITEEITAGELEVAAITDSTGTQADDVASAPIRTTPELEFDSQATASSTFVSDEPTDPGVLVEVLDMNAESTVVVTYEDGEDLIVAGASTFEASDLDGSGQMVPVEDVDGFPGDHTAHVIPTDDLSQAYEPGDTVSQETAEAALTQETATVLAGEVTLDDQTVEGSADDGDLTVDAELAGDEDALYVVDLHETDGDGAPGAFVGTTDVVAGTVDDEPLRLEAPDGEDLTIDETDEFIAMIHIVDDEEVEEGDAFPPASFPVLPNADAEEGFVPGGVTDAGIVEIEPPEPEGSLEFAEQATASSTFTSEDPTDPGVVVGDVESNVDSAVVVTYEEEDELIIAGLDTFSADALEGDDVAIPVEDADGFPGDHTAHVIPVDDLSEEYEPGDAVSEETAEAVLDNQAAQVFQGTVEFDDQTFDESIEAGDEVIEIETANLLDGADDDTAFVVDIHPTDDDGALVGPEFVGSSDVIEGTNEDVTIEAERVPEDGEFNEFPIDETDEFVAMIHIADQADVGDDASPGEFPVLPHADADGEIPSGVTDDGTVTIE